MEFEDLIEEAIESEVECSHRSSICKERRIRRRSFSFVCVPRNGEVVVTPEAQSDNYLELVKRIDDIQESQKGVNALLGRIDRRLTAIEKALKENMPQKCISIAARTQLSINSKTDAMEDENYNELALMLPISSEESLVAVEAKLVSKASCEALKRFLVKGKGRKGSVDAVMRVLFHDDVIYKYNLEGRCGKKALLKLKTADLVFNVFSGQTKEQTRNEIRRYVFRSHNRFKQKKHKLRVNNA